MNFFVADPNPELKSNLEKILGVSGCKVGDDMDFSFIKTVVSDPGIFFDCFEEGDSILTSGVPEEVKRYMKVMSDFRSMKLSVIFYSYASEERINSLGLEKDKHYSVYFNKENQKIEDVADYMKPFLCINMDSKN